MTDISAVLTSISTAIQITKDLREADNAIEKAELRLKLSEVVNGLADAKLAIAELREETHVKNEVISELRKALEAKGQFARVQDAYFETEPGGRPKGQPYCLRCYQDDHRARHLTRKPASSFWVCPTCKTEYDGRRILEHI